MSRTITSAVVAESAKAQGAKPILLARLAFDSSVETLWSGRGNLTWNGEVYRGVGDLGAVSGVEEGVEQRAFGVRMTLSGVPLNLLSLSLNEDVQGRRAEIWLGFLDANYALVADPVLVFRGRMDAMDASLGETATISLTAENRLADWNRPRVRRYTDAELQARFPGDKGLEFVNPTTEKEIVWGGKVAGGQQGGPVAAGQGAGAPTGARVSSGGAGGER